MLIYNCEGSTGQGCTLVMINTYYIHRVHFTRFLTLYLKAGAIEWPLLAISAPVLRGVTFEGSKINDNSFLYIYLKVLYPTGPKMIYKKFESCIIDQGVKLKYQKLNIIFNSEVIISCKLSK